MAMLRMLMDNRQGQCGAFLDEPSQQLLVERLRRGEKGALEQVAQLHGPRLLRLAHRLMGWNGDGEDVVQEVLAKLLARPDRIGGDRGLEAWLVAVTINQCRSHRRMARTFQNLLHRRARETQPPASEHSAEQRDVNHRVRQVVQNLRPKDREVIVLHHLELIPIAEIAKILGISANAVEVRLHRARRRLRQRLSGLI
jgi:RNA polymerase sigma-70 factor (ECF subfamily)